MRPSLCTGRFLDIQTQEKHLMIKYYMRDLYDQINFQQEMHDWWMLA